jgi:PAS domain S-box-containing protein
MTAPSLASSPAASTTPADFRRRLIAAVVFPLALLAVASLLLAAQIAWLSSAAHKVEKSDRITAQAYQVQGLVVDMEAGMRGFLLTGNERFLEPYDAADPVVAGEFTELSDLLAGGSAAETAHVAAARAAFEEWRSYSRELIDRRRKGGDFLSPLAEGQGKKRVDAIRRDIKFVLDAQFQHRRASNASSARATYVVIAAGILMTATVALLIALFTVRQLTGLAHSYRGTMASMRRQSDAFRESEQRFRAIFEQAPVAIVQTDLEGHFLRFNDRLCEITGYTKAELEQMKLSDLTHADERAAEENQWRQIVTGGSDAAAASSSGTPGDDRAKGSAAPAPQPSAGRGEEGRGGARTSSAEKRLVRKDGSVIYAGVTSAMLESPGGRAATVLVTIEDVTARRYFAGPIRRLGARFKHAAEVIGIGTWDFNLATGEAIWSERQEILFGLAPGTFAGTGDAFLAMILPEDRSKVLEAGRRAVEQRVPYRAEYRITRPSDGQIRWMADSGDVIAGGPEKQVTHLIGITVDITDRKLAGAAGEGGATSL